MGRRRIGSGALASGAAPYDEWLLGGAPPRMQKGDPGLAAVGQVSCKIQIGVAKWMDVELCVEHPDFE